jgi:glycosyltransferase involved in cell wall biosynthesis
MARITEGCHSGKFLDIVVASAVSEQPLVSIVTPSFNMAPYLRDAIESVLSQDYPNIEYLIMDGGSTDGTLEVLSEYRGRLRYISAADRGAADAINRGCDLTQGSIFAWLSADDTYLSGAVSAAVERLASSPDLAGVYGQGYWVDEQGKVIQQYPTAPFSPELLQEGCGICQPACFVRRSAFEQAGRLNPNLHVVFDYDLWIRMARSMRFEVLPDFLATSRMYANNKTLSDRQRMFRECFEVLRNQYGYIPFQWIYGYCCYLLDHRDQFFEPLRPSVFKYVMSLPLGCWHNRRRMGRYSTEWFSKMQLRSLLW